jgi:cell division protein FtsL
LIDGKLYIINPSIRGCEAMVQKKKKKGSFFKRNKIGLILIGILIAYLSITMINQQIKLNQLMKEEKQAQERVEELKQKVSEMKKLIEESENPEFIEKIAREKLKMVKQNEIIYIIQDKEKSD